MTKSRTVAGLAAAGMLSTVTLIAAPPAGASSSAGVATAADQDGLPVRRITLYRSGVGAFERTGRVTGDEDVQLRVAADQVNDILKSMVMLDLDGGRIESASYGSREPLARRLASFMVDLSDAPSRAELLGRLRGVEVRLKRADGDIEGRVMGVESSPVPMGEGTASMPHVLIASGGGIEAVRLDQVRSFEVLDGSVRAEIDRALAAIAEQRTDRVKTLDLAFRGAGDRDVVVSYIHEMPVWKTSYRLVLPEEGSDGGLLMQGWAIVENTTDEDWQDVQLGLVAGRPVGFQMDLYEPLFLARPQVPVPVEQAAAPRTYRAGIVDGDVVALEPSPGGGGQGGRRYSPARQPRPDGAAANQPAGSLFGGDIDDSGRYRRLQSTDQVASVTNEGAIFRFQLDEPVTIERRRSAMLPIINTSVAGRSVSIWTGGGTNPMLGIELENTSGLQLMPGPISVYDANSYAGDAQIDFVPSGADRLISYAVDLEVNVRRDDTATQTVRRVRVVDGVLEETIARTNRQSFTIRNDDPDEARTMILELPLMSGWDLVSPEPAEETATARRFETTVPADTTGVLVVAYERTERTRIALADADVPTLLIQQQNGLVSAEVLAAVREARRLGLDVVLARRQQDMLLRERRDIVADQERIRENLTRVESGSGLADRYLGKLDEQESRLEAIAAEVAEADRDIKEREAAQREFLRNLTIE